MERELAKQAVFLALTVWVAHFIYFRHFGLYEDDYALVSPALAWSLPDLFNNALSVFLIWPQGRPLNFFLPAFFSFVGTQLGGLHVTYLIALSIVTLNAILFYCLLKRVSSETTAVIGAWTFCLFPADTTHAFLTHAFHLQTSLTFLLIASLCYLSGKPILSYFFISGSLLAYESAFMPFLAIPLLRRKWDGALIKELARHVAILLAMILVVFLVRISLGEERVTEMEASISSLAHVALKAAAAVFIGPAASLALFVYGPIRTLGHWNFELSVVFVASLTVFTWLLRRLKVDPTPDRRSGPAIFTSRGTAHAAAQYSGIAQLLMSAAVMLCLAYIVSFTHFPPIARHGRETSVHLAAAFGGSLLFASVCSVFLSIANRHRLKTYAISILALYFSLVVAYRFSIQLDFKQAWQNQRAFWSGAIANLPDMTDETIVFVLDHNLPKTRYILTNSWADAIILSQIFQFPREWKNPPRLFVIHHDWTERLVREGDQFKWEVPTATWWSHWEVLPDSNVILLEMDHGKLVRRFRSVNIKGLSLKLKPMPPDAKMTWQKGFIYDYLIEKTSDHSSSAESKTRRSSPSAARSD